MSITNKQSDSKAPDFCTLSRQHPVWQTTSVFLDTHLAVPDTPFLQQLKNTWCTLDKNDDTALSNWLITLFNELFKNDDTLLVRGSCEPEYFAKTAAAPAKIVFAHGYFASALHEISHWCIAGSARRQLDDFGYWYCPDGRNQAMQARFEQVEIRPQAIECLFMHATGHKFFVSADNLNANFQQTNNAFAQNIYNQVLSYLHQPTSLPPDAQKLLAYLLHLC